MRRLKTADSTPCVWCRVACPQATSGTLRRLMGSLHLCAGTRTMKQLGRDAFHRVRSTTSVAAPIATFGCRAYFGRDAFHRVRSTATKDVPQRRVGDFRGVRRFILRMRRFGRGGTRPYLRTPRRTGFAKTASVLYSRKVKSSQWSISITTRLRPCLRERARRGWTRPSSSWAIRPAHTESEAAPIAP